MFKLKINHNGHLHIQIQPIGFHWYAKTKKKRDEYPSY